VEQEVAQVPRAEHIQLRPKERALLLEAPAEAIPDLAETVAEAEVVVDEAEVDYIIKSDE